MPDVVFDHRLYTKHQLIAVTESRVQEMKPQLEFRKTGNAVRFTHFGSFWLSVVGLLLPGAPGCRTNERACLFQRDDETGFLAIERMAADGLVGCGPVKIETSRGEKQFREVRGDCAFVFEDIARVRNGVPVVVETKDASYYRVVYDADAPASATLVEVADRLGLEIAHERRSKLVFVVRENQQERTGIERFQGQPRWPEARTSKRLDRLGLPELTYGQYTPWEIKKFPNGGILFVRQKFDDDNSIPRDGNLYFDGVSFDELAHYFADELAFPVVSETKNEFLYSFTLPDNIWKRFSFDKTVPLPGLGVSVVSDEVEMEVVLVRDKGSGGSARSPESHENNGSTGT